MQKFSNTHTAEISTKVAGVTLHSPCTHCKTKVLEVPCTKQALQLSTFSSTTETLFSTVREKNEKNNVIFLVIEC